MSRTSILTSVIKMISSDRAATHGDAHKQFATAQELKVALMDGSLASGRELGPTEAEALDLICTKLSRIVHGQPHLDHWADIAGYAALAGEAVELQAGMTERHSKQTRDLLKKVAPWSKVKAKR